MSELVSQRQTLTQIHYVGGSLVFDLFILLPGSTLLHHTCTGHCCPPHKTVYQLHNADMTCEVPELMIPSVTIIAMHIAQQCLYNSTYHACTLHIQVQGKDVTS